MKLVVLLMIVCAPLVSRADAPCVSEHGAATAEALVRGVMDALGRDDRDALKRFAVDECAFVRAQFAYGTSGAETMRRMSRDADLGRMLRAYRGASQRLPADAVLDSEQEMRAGDDRVRAVFLSAKERRYLSVEVAARRVADRWYLAGPEVVVRHDKASVLVAWDDLTTFVRDVIGQHDDYVGPLAQQWPPKRATLEPLGAELRALTGDDRKHAIVIATAASSQVHGERSRPEIARFMRDVEAILGARVDFVSPTGVAECDAAFRRSIACVRPATRGFAAVALVGEAALCRRFESTPCDER